ncbi:MAG: hypothetical protein K1X92_05890 [Bacteroidia bacterium]|nr:hypothetical protein [Bacteroidia bacterium]
MIRHFSAPVLIWFLFIFQISFLNAQDEPEESFTPGQKSLEFGINLGAGLSVPAGVENTGTGALMTPAFKLLYLGSVVDTRGVSKTTLMFPRTVGVNFGYRQKGDSPLNGWALKAGVNLTNQVFYFNYPSSIAIPGITSSSGWIQDIKYANLSLCFQKEFNGFYAQGKIGYGFGFKQDDETLPKTGSIPYNYVDNGYGAVVNQFPLKPMGAITLTPGFGYTGIYKQTVPYELGIGVQIPFGSVFSQRFDLVQNSQPVGENTVNYNLNMIYVDLNIPITVYKFAGEKNKPEPRPKPEPKPDKPKQPEKDVIVENSPRKEVKNFKEQESFTVKKSIISVRYWDNHTPDGDIISLYLNGELVVKNQKVESKYKELKLNLKPGDNYLIMRAVNEGRIPPNTAAISVNDGQETQTAILRAKKRKNVAIKIVYEP